MALVPIRYPLRSAFVRWRSSLFAAIGIGCTVAVFAGILALRAGFDEIYAESGSEDVALYMRPGATSEGESGLRDEVVEVIKKERPEVARDAGGEPLAAAETYLALNLDRVGGGSTNVPIRGVEEASIKIQGDLFRIVDGQSLSFGADEIIVGRSVSERIQNCALGDTLLVNVTPFRVVGIFEHDGPYASEIWGDVDRIGRALDLGARQRIVAKLVPGTDVKALAKELEEDKRSPAKVLTERDYLNSQKGVVGFTLAFLAVLISTIMGVAAVLGATTTMLASIGSRNREVGIFLSLGFGRFAIFLAFLIEALIVGVFGGIIGAIAVLPFDGMQTGTTNFQTFTEVSFAFRVGPGVLLAALIGAVILGVLGGVIPAWRAARLLPTQALRRH